MSSEMQIKVEEIAENVNSFSEVSLRMAPQGKIGRTEWRYRRIIARQCFTVEQSVSFPEITDGVFVGQLREKYQGRFPSNVPENGMDFAKKHCIFCSFPFKIELVFLSALPTNAHPKRKMRALQLWRTAFEITKEFPSLKLFFKDTYPKGKGMTFAQSCPFVFSGLPLLPFMR